MKCQFLFLALVAVALVGCNNEKVRNLIDERVSQANQGIQEAKAPAPARKYDPLLITDKIWAGGSSLRMRHGLPLPSKFEGSKGIALISGEPLQLSDIASVISSQTNIPVRISSGTIDAGISGGMTIAYEGSLSGLLDHVASHFGINWRYDGTAINFSRFETRVFVVEALPGTQTITDGVKESESQGGSGGSGGGSQSSGTSSLKQSAEMSVELKAWDELKETITAMLGGVGTLVVAPSTGTITVTTTPELMRTVAKFIEEENKRLSRQIAINVEIYKVELSQGTDFSFEFAEVLRRMSNIKEFTFVGPTNLPLVSGSPLSTAGATGGMLSVAILNPSGHGATYGFFQALSSIGDTTRVAQFPLTTLNNRPVSRRVGRDRAYVASVQNTSLAGTTAGATVSSTITPGTIREGFSLQLTPRLLDDGRIMLQYSLSLTDIVRVTTFGDASTGSAVQLPETASRVFVQQSLLKSGSTLVLAGVDDEQTAQNAEGVGHPFNFLLGGASSNVTARSMMFIAITPQVIEFPGPEQG